MNDFSPEIAQLQADIAALQAAIQSLAALPNAQRPLLDQLAEKQQGLTQLQTGGVNLGIGTQIGEIGDIIVGDKIIQQFFGNAPSEQHAKQLSRYLHRLAVKMQRLPLASLTPHLDDGKGIALPQVYVMLATMGVEAVDLEGFITDYVEPATEAEYVPYVPFAYTPHQPFNPDWVLPDQAIIDVHYSLPTQWTAMRARLATEAVHNHRHLVLLGDPGGGKSTFLQHLAWSLTQRGLCQRSTSTVLFGWEDTTIYLPLLLPLRTLAGKVARTGPTPATVSVTLCDELTSEYDVRDAATLLEQALDNGAALLLLDGLDEVPLQGASGVADRLTVLRVVRTFIDLYSSTRCVLTCRVRAFDEVSRGCLDWPVETIAPFTLGQMRHFVVAWYEERTRHSALTHEQADQQRNDIIAALADPRRPRLRDMAQTPLLLAMMALVRAEKGELPRDRALLYERIMEQLLGTWDAARGGQSLAQVIGDERLDSGNMRSVLDQLCYAAHLGVVAADGRGRLTSDAVHLALTKHFAQVKVAGAWEAATRCIEYFADRSGLLLPEAQSDTFAFAHLTLQEYGAGRYMLLQPDAVRQVMQRRDDDRWREPISLGLGVIHQQQPALSDRITSVMTELIDPDEQGKPKPRPRWYRDLILAAELGAERDWDLLRPLINVDRLQRDLRHSLVTLLDDKEQPLPVNERVRSGLLLGNLGDKRYPVTIDEWGREVAQCNEQFGQSSSYWCYVRPGTYRIGGWTEHEPSADSTLPAFWIARFPVTVAQYAGFMAIGGYNEEQWWTPQGWHWKQKYKRVMPLGWNDVRFHAPNQPISGVMWFEAAAFARWCAAQLAALLPPASTLRLPTEAEWEIAAAYDGSGLRLAHPWGAAPIDLDRASYAASNRTTPPPVGCCPAGAAACGACDLLGSVWEWATSRWVNYPYDNSQGVSDFKHSERGPSDEYDVPLRGGAWDSAGDVLGCWTRKRSRPVNMLDQVGFRLVLVPTSIARV